MEVTDNIVKIGRRLAKGLFGDVEFVYKEPDKEAADKFCDGILKFNKILTPEEIEELREEIKELKGDTDGRNG